MTEPADDEIEITLFGRGVGESVVMHLLHREWIIVDTFRDGGVPVAQTYLDRIGVTADQVKTIVVTHFHLDHYDGVDLLHDHYPQARLAVTGALKGDAFLDLADDLEEPSYLGPLPSTMRRAQDRVLAGSVRGLRYMSVGKNIFDRPHGRVTAMAPSDAAIDESCRLIRAEIDTKHRPNVTNRLRNDNRSSIVLRVEINGIVALLCGDLEATPPEYGWNAVVFDPEHQQLPLADLVKVPHHGSDDADDPDMWTNLVHPTLGYSSRRTLVAARPRDTDVTRLHMRGAQLWQAAPSTRWVDDEFGNRIKQPSITGWVRARRTLGETSWRIDAQPPGQRVMP